MATTSSSRILRSVAKVMANSGKVEHCIDSHHPDKRVNSSTSSTHSNSKKPLPPTRVLRSSSKNVTIRPPNIENNRTTERLAIDTSRKMNNSNTTKFERILRSSANHAKIEKSLENIENTVDVQSNKFEMISTKHRLTITDEEDKENNPNNKKRRPRGKRMMEADDRHEKQKGVSVSSKTSIVKRVFFGKNEIVFAKMRGYCPWPAKVIICHCSKIRSYLFDFYAS